MIVYLVLVCNIPQPAYLPQLLLECNQLHQCSLQGHRVEYDDGDSLYEDLMHRTHRLPDLAGSKVFNPEADAESLMMTYNGPGSGTATAVSSDVESGVVKASTKSDVRPGPESDKKPAAKAGMKPGAKAGMKTGMALKGQRIEVWWAQDEAFYPGIITSYKKVICCKGFMFRLPEKGLVSCPVASWRLGATVYMYGCNILWTA